MKSRPRDRGDRMKKDRNSEPSSKPTAADVKQNKPESNRDEKRRLEREQRELKRKEERQRFRDERDQKRQAERERNRKERENNKKEDVKTEKSSVKLEADLPSKGNQKEDRSKRYSESRRARMESKEAVGTTEKPSNDSRIEDASGKSVPPMKRDDNENVSIEKSETDTKARDYEKSKAAEDARNNDDSSGDNAKESSSKPLTKEERMARRVRNKVKLMRNHHPLVAGSESIFYFLYLLRIDHRFKSISLVK